ncbi:MAG: SRPBCC domain-containing protein [Saprospiraceae bacterium]|nr:SRPBCC domain-containing protein [Saprospiraceae bacterium]
MPHSFSVTVSFPVSPKSLYNAWLDSHEHAAMTGGEATCGQNMGDDFSAWDGYITGRNLRLEQHELIVQSWRTQDFQPEDGPSRIEIQFKASGEGCDLTLLHSDIPDGQPDYEQGWEEHYFAPMRAYFSS